MKNVMKTFCVLAVVAVALPGISGNTESDLAFGGAYATFAGKFGGEVSMLDLKGNDEIDIAGCAAGSQILKFTLVIRSGKHQAEFVGNSGKLTKEMREALLKLYTGDTFIFQNMQARLPNGGTVDVRAKAFIVTGGPQRS